MLRSAQPSVAAVILAAGRSIRMGQAKQLLPLAGTTLLETTLAMVRRAAIEELVLVLGASAGEIQDQIQDKLATRQPVIVVNQDYAQGIAGSLKAGISALSPDSSAALIVLADQPFVQPDTLTHLIAEYHRSRQQILIPTHRGSRGNPVLIDRALFPEVMQLQGDIGCRAIFARHPQTILNIEVEDEGILLDIDNQEDYRRLRGRPRSAG